MLRSSVRAQVKEANEKLIQYNGGVRGRGLWGGESSAQPEDTDRLIGPTDTVTRWHSFISTLRPDL